MYTLIIMTLNSSPNLNYKITYLNYYFKKTLHPHAICHLSSKKNPFLRGHFQRSSY